MNTDPTPHQVGQLLKVVSDYATTLTNARCRARNPIDSEMAVCICSESYTGEYMPASVGAQVCELLIGRSSLDNSVSVEERTSRS